jgi:RecA-family ATPase
MTRGPDDFDAEHMEEVSIEDIPRNRRGERRQRGSNGTDPREDAPPIGERAGDSAPKIKATPFKWIEPAAIPRRKWLYGRHYIRDFVSQTVAPGGHGKSSLVLVETLAIVANLPLLGVMPHESVPAWYWNGEDPGDELDRRVISAALRHGLDRSQLEGRLFIDNGRKTKIIIAEQTRQGAKIARPVVDAVIATIRANRIGLMTIDPFVACHSVSENDNPAIEIVAGAWAEIADVTSCAIELVHHPRKTGGGDVTVEDGRGGSALLAKTRSARA